ncbi:tRNA (cytidine(34)-2'-O)-methyltransferase [Lacibacterium aquatile]|uniref:tRNA (cytidine(34)-2'-O)-methyltransferase n=1 Tax=Lacibacterium aquatile TaxID=1168082 RepID=A0ABW5DM02_9PROT
MRLVLFQPDIAQNAGTILRLAACLGVGVDVIEPCGFPFDAAKFRRAGMDYLDQVDWQRHSSWQAYLATEPQGRLVLLSTKASTRLEGFEFQPGDRLLFGQESAGVPAEVAEIADAGVRIPLAQGVRSLNVAVAAAITAFEALRQTQGLPQ